MGAYRPGYIVWRRGTVGASREAIDHPVVIVAVNERETLGGQVLYTCAPVTSEPSSAAGAVEFRAGSEKKKYANLSRLLIAGGGTFVCPAGRETPVLGNMNSSELTAMKGTVDALMSVSGKHLGKILYSATPSHDGVRGKTHRPYALVGEIGRGSGHFIAVPVSSTPGPCSNGSEIADLKAAGLVRDEGEASYTRLAWTSALSTRTASKEAGRLSEGDRQNLYRQFLAFKGGLISGLDAEISGKAQGAGKEVESMRTPALPKPTGLEGALTTDASRAQKTPLP